MIEPKDLGPLLGEKAGSHPCLTVYLDVTVGGDGQRHHGVFLRRAIAEKEKEWATDRILLPQFRKTVAEVNRYLENRLGEGTQGIVFFAWEPAGFFRVYELPVPVENSFRVASRPYLLPLARAITGQSRYGIAAVSLDQAQFWSIYLRRVTESRRLEDETVPKRVQAGGWSQMRFQRHHEFHVDRFLKDVAKELKSFCERERCDHLVLLGHEPALSDFQRELPTSLKQRLSLVDNGSLEESQAALLNRLEPLFRGREEAIMRDIQERLAGNYHAVAGDQEVLAALQQGRLGKLALAADLQREGGRCDSCSTLSEKSSGSCALCGGTLGKVDLGEEIVRESLRQNVHLHFIEEYAALEELNRWGGVAGVLRF